MGMVVVVVFFDMYIYISLLRISQSGSGDILRFVCASFSLCFSSVAGKKNKKKNFWEEKKKNAKKRPTP